MFERNPTFLDRENFFFPFLFFLVPFSLFPLERNTKEHKTTTKKEKYLLQSSVVFLDSSSCHTFQSQRRRIRVLACSRQIVFYAFTWSLLLESEDRTSLFFLLFAFFFSPSKAPERTKREKRGDETQKKLFSRKGKNLLCKSPKKQEEEEEKKHKKGEENKRWCRDTFWFKLRTRWIVIDSLRMYPSRGELWTIVLTFYEAHEPRHFSEIFFLMSFFSFSFLLFSSRFAWFSTRERERAREDKFLLFLRTQKEKKYQSYRVLSARAVKVAQTRDIKTDHQNRRRTRFVYPPRARFLLLCTWSRFDISTRARNIFYGFLFFLLSLVLSDFFFLFSSCKKTEEVSRFGLSRKREEKEEGEKEFFFVTQKFSLFSFLLSFLLSFLFARTRTLLIESSSVILQQRTIKLSIEIASGT